MTDQYYEQEDNVADTPENALVHWQAASSQVANYVPEAAQDLTLIEQVLGFAYQQTADPDAQAQIADAWQRIQNTTQKLVQLDTVKQLAQTALIKAQEAYAKIEEREKLVKEEFTELQDALDDVENEGYSAHPRIAGIVEILEENLSGEYLGGLYLECPGCEAANYWYDTPLEHDAVNDLCLALFSANAEDIPPPLREELAVFINGWVAKWDAHIDTLREQARDRMAAEEEAAE